RSYSHDSERRRRDANTPTPRGSAGVVRPLCRRFGGRRHDLRLTGRLQRRVDLGQVRGEHTLVPRVLGLELRRQDAEHVVRLLRWPALTALDETEERGKLVVDPDREVERIFA